MNLVVALNIEENITCKYAQDEKGAAMSDQNTVDVVDEAAQNVAETTEETAPAPAPKRKSKKKFGIIGGVVAVIVVAAVGFWVWHNDPSFCNNPVCHDSMDPYVNTYYQEDGVAGVDKWGSSVTNTHAMLSIAHKDGNIACLDCHTADIQQQIGEVGIQLSGGYTMPLDEVNALSLVENRHQASPSGLGDEFCMNDACHKNLTRESLTQLTASLEFNPHSWHHQQNQCTDCHKSHRASVLVCTQCHDGSDPTRPDARGILPDGWVDYKTSQDLRSAATAA